MRRINFVRFAGAHKGLFALLASGALFTSGCSNMTSTAPVSASSLASAGNSIGGKVHGGAQPVVGAAVTLYAASQSTTASAVSLATATTAADGTFSFAKNGSGSNAYTCPASDPLVYVIAKGGNTVNDGNPANANSAAAFMGIYGTCNEISSSNFLLLNEATTVATMLAVQQYFNPASEGLSSSGTGGSKNAIDNTINTIALLVNPGTGTAQTSTSVAGVGGGLSTVSVTVTPEQQKVNLLSNIIAACVNTTSSSAQNCQTLFTSAVAPSPQVTANPGTTFPASTDVLLALYYMVTNPTSNSSSATDGGLANRTALFNLAPAAGAPFAPSLSSTPADWTVAMSYSSTSTCGTGTIPGLISAPGGLAIDQNGNVWIANNTGNLVQISGSGAAVTCNTYAVGSSPASSSVFIDSATPGAGNVWTALNGSSTITRYSPTTSTSLTFTSPDNLAVLSIAGDGNGNVFYSTGLAVYEIAGGASLTSATTPAVMTTQVQGAVSLMPDKTNTTLWAVNGTGNLYQIAGPATVTPVVTLFTTSAAAHSLITNGSNSVFVSALSPSNDLTYFAGSGTNYSIQSGWPISTSFAGITQPAAVAVDGANNIWAANNAAATGGLFGVSEVSLLGGALSPDTAAGGFQKAASYLNGASSITIDQSGNVWVAGGASSNNFVTEIVGAGVPLYQPYSLGLLNGRFQGRP